MYTVLQYKVVEYSDEVRRMMDQMTEGFDHSSYNSGIAQSLYPLHHRLSYDNRKASWCYFKKIKVDATDTRALIVRNPEINSSPLGWHMRKKNGLCLVKMFR